MFKKSCKEYTNSNLIIIEVDISYAFMNNKTVRLNVAINSIIFTSILLVSCSVAKLSTGSVSYQSFRTLYPQPTKESPIPEDAKIAIAISITVDGQLSVTVFNRTSDIMTIDQTKSFFVNSSGVSKSYYDPTVRTTTVTDVASATEGISVNLGAVTSALGIGGPLGVLASGVNVGSAGTSGRSTTETTYFSDQPYVSLGPYGSGVMSKAFRDPLIGKSVLSSVSPVNYVGLSPHETSCKCKVCISYSLDGEKTYDTIVTDIYVNSLIVSPVTSEGAVNETLRSIFVSKPDALNEYCFVLYFNSQFGSSIEHGVLFDYK